jgi:hypothetical protein
LLVGVQSEPTGAQLSGKWQEAESEIFAFLDSVGATEDAYTMTIRLVPQEIASPQRFVDTLNAQIDKDETWAFLTTSPDRSGVRRGYAMPVRGGQPANALLFPFVEVHTVLVAWWLTTAWRTRQLAQAASTLAKGSEVVASAACVRPLVETAASFWVDASKIISAWDEIKRHGPPTRDADAFKGRTGMMVPLNEATWGSKFDDRAPDLKELWGRVQRSNVLGQVEKLSKHAPSLQGDYQWLCNTVHPSLGNTLAFSAPPLRHETKTHLLTGFAGRPVHIEDSSGVHAERSLQTSTARAAAVALAVLRISLDSALRSIDDVALVTGAPAISPEQYWRNLTVPARNDPCPCRSGLKAKRCSHSWGSPAPEFPTSFEARLHV